MDELISIIGVPLFLAALLYSNSLIHGVQFLVQHAIHSQIHHLGFYRFCTFLSFMVSNNSKHPISINPPDTIGIIKAMLCSVHFFAKYAELINVGYGQQTLLISCLKMNLGLIYSLLCQGLRLAFEGALIALISSICATSSLNYVYL